MIGLFGKYSTKFDFNADGTLQSLIRNYAINFSQFEQSSNTIFQFIPSLASGSPTNQALIDTTLIAYNGDIRGKQSYSKGNTGVYPESLFSFSNAVRRYEYGTTVNRAFQIYFNRPDLVYLWSSRAANALGSGFTGTLAMPYLINCESIAIHDIANFTAITGMYPPKLKWFAIYASTTLNSLPGKLPPTLLGLSLTGSNTLGAVANLNNLISESPLIEHILFTAVITGDEPRVAMVVGTGTLDLSVQTGLKTIQISSSVVTDITTASSVLENVILRNTTTISVSSLVALMNSFLSNSAHYLLNITNNTKSVSKSFIDTDFKSTLQKFYIYGNYFVGYLTLTTSKTVCTDFELGATGTSITNASTGKNATANSATAGAATIENGGAGGAGGSNNNGATASNYGGGGGGSGRTSGTRLGGAGANGLIRISYTTGGVFTQQTFTSSSSFSTPSDVSEMVIECWGAGGSGGTRGSVTGGSGGGGGGAYAIKRLTVSPSTSYNYTIGVGGAAGTGTVVADGFDGGDTFWDAGAAVKAAGGKKGLGTQTGGNGGAIADCVGDSVFAGGNGSTKTTNVSPGGGGGGAAGSTGLKNNFPIVDVTGLTHATTIDLSNCQITQLSLPVNTVLTSLYLGGNNLNLNDSTLKAQILALTGLTDLSFTTANTSTANETLLTATQTNLTNIPNLDLSTLSVLLDFTAPGIYLTGNITLPASIRTINVSSCILLNGIAGSGSFPSCTAIRAQDQGGADMIIDIDYTRFPAFLSVTIGGNTVQSLVDLSGRTAVTNLTGINAIRMTALTTVILPAAINAVVSITGGSNSGYIGFAQSTLLTSITGLENISYSTLTSTNTSARAFEVESCALNQDLKIGVNGFLPRLITCQNNAMSIANVDLNLWNIINNRTKWNTTTVAKSINIAGTNGTPTGTYAAPTGYRTHAALTVTAVTKANPGVVTVSAIGSVANGDVVYFYDCTGMTELNGNYYRVSNVSGNTFELETPAGVDVNTTGYGTYTGSAGRCRPDGDLSGGTDTKRGTYVLVTQYGWTITQN